MTVSHARRPTRTPLVCILLAVAALAAGAADWPQFHGPRRDNMSDETGLLKQWPADGPKLLWTATGIGAGFSSVAIAGGLVYTTGNVGADTVLTALNLAGEAQWTAKNGPADKHDRPGTRSTPTVDGDCLYHENSDGDLACLEAKTGKQLWALNLVAKFNGQSPRWGHAESPLVDGEHVICVPGGTEAGMVALNKRTGGTVWASKGTTEKPGYGSPIAIEFGGVRQYVTMMEKSVIGVRADTGKLLWRVPHNAFAEETASTPLYQDGFLFVSTLPPGATQCIALTAQGDRITAKQAWQSAALDDHHGGMVLLNGYLYGASLKGKWVCLEAKKGRLAYSADGVGKGSVTYADGMLYTLSEEGGTVGLVKATPDGHDIVSQFRLPAGGNGPVWAHPVVCGGRLYLRHGDSLYCYDIQAR